MSDEGAPVYFVKYRTNPTEWLACGSAIDALPFDQAPGAKVRHITEPVDEKAAEHEAAVLREQQAAADKYGPDVEQAQLQVLREIREEIVRLGRVPES